MNRTNWRWAPLLVGGFVLMIMLGASLLSLPASIIDIKGQRFYYIDAAFISGSALCATALPLRDISTTFTPLGQAIILALVQIGGLAILICGAMLGLRLRGFWQEQDPAAIEGQRDCRHEVSQAIAFVVISTFAIELLGAVLMYPMFAKLPGSGGFVEAAWYSVFHSVCAYCNAGFSLYGDRLLAGVPEGWPTPLRDHWQIIGVMAPLMVLGSVGMPVLRDCASAAGDFFARLAGRPSVNRPRLSLHTKLALSMTVMMIVLGASGIMLIERPVGANDRASGAFDSPIKGNIEREDPDWTRMGANGRVRESFFQAISARTGGYNTIDLSQMSNGGKLWMAGLMIVGASPASAGGGLKTVTLAVLVLLAWSTLLRRENVETFGRPIEPGVLRQSVALGAIYFVVLAAVMLAVSLTVDPRENFMDIFFESASAVSNVGLSTGLTARITHAGKLVLLLGMLAGRVLPPAAVLLMTLRGSRQDVLVE